MASGRRVGKRRWEEEGSVELARSWGPPKEPEPLWRPRSWAWVCLPSVPALGFACTILASELEIIHSKNRMKIEVSYFLLPQSQLNFQNLIIWLHYICYHFDPNVTKKKIKHKRFIIYNKLNNIMCFLSYFKCLWTGNEIISVAVPS